MGTGQPIAHYLAPAGSKPKKDADPVETTYANIRAFTKDQRDAFMKKMMDNEDSTDF